MDEDAEIEVSLDVAKVEALLDVAEVGILLDPAEANAVDPPELIDKSTTAGSNTARCTCPIDAAANGTGSNSKKLSRQEGPSAEVMTC